MVELHFLLALMKYLIFFWWDYVSYIKVCTLVVPSHDKAFRFPSSSSFFPHRCIRYTEVYCGY
jgi:hypothetical protein